MKTCIEKLWEIRAKGAENFLVAKPPGKSWLLWTIKKKTHCFLAFKPDGTKFTELFTTDKNGAILFMGQVMSK